MKVAVLCNTGIGDAREENEASYVEISSYYKSQGHEIINEFEFYNPLSPETANKVLEADIVAVGRGCENNSVLVSVVNKASAMGKKIERFCPTKEELVTSILYATSISAEDFFGCKRKRINVLAREVYSKLRRESGLSLANIGGEINKKHCSVVWMLKNHDIDYINYPAYRNVYDSVLKFLRNENLLGSFCAEMERQTRKLTQKKKRV